MGQPKLSTVVHGFDILKSIIGLARTYNPVFLFSAIAASAAILGAAVALWVLYSWLRPFATIFTPVAYAFEAVEIMMQMMSRVAQRVACRDLIMGEFKPETRHTRHGLSV